MVFSFRSQQKPQQRAARVDDVYSDDATLCETGEV
jgi:hypothetical protein